MIKPYTEKFGAGFNQRAQEAIRCYGAHAYLACCTMYGAATESIFLRTAIEFKNEEDVMKLYISASGRSKVEKLLLT